MITASIIFSATFLAIVQGRIPSAVVALLGAMLMVFFGVVGSEEALKHIDLNVILLLVAMMTLAEILGRSGVFVWTAIKGAQLVRGHGILILGLLALITAVASAFLDNVTTVVLMVPVTISLCRVLDLNPIPFLLAEVFASNIGGTATVIGDPPNIIIASVGDISFLTFMVNIGPVTLISTAVLFLMLYVWFRHDVKVSDEKRQSILEQSPSDAIKDKQLLKKGLIVFALTIVGFLIHDLLNISPAFVALAGASILLLISGLQPREVLQGVE